MLRTEAKRTLALAFPIVIGEIAQMALHLIDAAMVGAISYKQLAASALVLNAMNIPFVIGIGMTISVSQMVSLAHGKRDRQLVSHYFFNGFILCAVTALVIAGLLLWGTPFLESLGQDPEVVRLAIPFMKLMAISIVPMLLFMTLKQFADGLQFTKMAMALSLLALPLNVFLNWLLIFGNAGFPRLELVGAGWSTLITRSIICLILGIVIFRNRQFRPYIAVGKTQWKFKSKTIYELLHIGIPSSLQIGMEAGAFAVSGIIIGTLGAVPQAAHQIALSCASFTFMVSMGLAQAGSIRVSNAFGANERQKIIVIGKSTLATALLYGILCAIGFTLFRNILPTLFNDNQAVIETAAGLLLCAAVFQISDSTQAIGAGLLRGIKDVKLPTILVGIAYWVVGLPVGYLLGIHFGWGPYGIWIGLIAGLTLASVFLISRFLSQTRIR
ncbi:MATE family efflux transporter [Flavihumibacter petaseus]|uniref:Multidrug-efflux transporter n=1 Tax=Flavihumibacter petaseus NBRC 106054 TaxID=1220578 RepID=A0A0E9N8B2_9BACT|nr:MATE family efflux transporter [Flavihumibacter petaseus]GAO45625.1 putative multidrug transporter [Flavihumibacter petaseus NBRC 106054]